MRAHLEKDPAAQYYSVREAARILGWTERTVYSKVKSGEIPSRRFGDSIRIPRVAIDAGAFSLARSGSEET